MLLQRSGQPALFENQGNRLIYSIPMSLDIRHLIVDQREAILKYSNILNAKIAKSESQLSAIFWLIISGSMITFPFPNFC
jgi:hypothetical protein